MRARDAARIHACSRVRHAHLVAAERAESGGRLTSECLGDPFSHRPSVAAIRAYVFSQPPKRWHARSADVRVSDVFKVKWRAVGAWLSLVEHSVRDRGVGGSNPLAPTTSSLKNPRKSLTDGFSLSPKDPCCVGGIRTFLVLPGLAWVEVEPSAVKIDRRREV